MNCFPDPSVLSQSSDQFDGYSSSFQFANTRHRLHNHEQLFTPEFDGGCKCSR